MSARISTVAFDGDDTLGHSQAQAVGAVGGPTCLGDRAPAVGAV